MTCRMVKVGILCAYMSQTASKIKVKTEVFHSQFCNKMSAIKDFPKPFLKMQPIIQLV